ncbi:related to alpha-1,2-galactosyltransferase [Cephalotrichum gorgonifer]|uniref:Related to alpha-1,2-galactosyltransferase n=1 Tax=Cephalotrichum gorgonifer TaxID=2041049 RepID=A0AAE8N0U4_9PEZI|nr:related to alpha-1,2-galactosyltransferase [Cephalotrichum gorgonifer]
MHFAYPPRKSSNPPPFRPRSSRLAAARRSRLRTVALIGVGFLFLLYLLRGKSTGTAKGTTRHIPSGSPPVVIVTVVNYDNGMEYADVVKENRISYAKLHGYETFFPHIGDYDLRGSPMSWTKVVALRHALAKFPDASYIWFLDQEALIMNPEISVHKDILAYEKLDKMMLRRQPVTLPESVIKTYPQLKPNQIDLVLTQDKEGVDGKSMILRNSDWSEFFLDTWYDPLFRSYNFELAETHTLEHIIQWHATILSKLALIPQRTMNSYSDSTLGEAYAEGDFVVRFPGCTGTGEKSCQQEASRYNERWRKAFASA